MLEKGPRPVRSVQIYYRTWDWLEKLVSVIRACYTGIWLGVLSREALHGIDQAYYDGLLPGTQRIYYDETYNRRGLFAWESDAIQCYFPAPPGGIMLVGAGGGREVLALSRMGYEVDGYECHPALADAANRLLEREGLPARVQVHERDCIPPGEETYQGLILGWGAYMLIQGSRRRIALLSQLRNRVRSGSPILMSFFSRPGGPDGDPFRVRLVSWLGNLLRRALGRELLEPGDDLLPNYVHQFTQAQIQAELEAAGFSLAFFSTQSYGHAVGIAGEQRSE